MVLERVVDFVVDTAVVDAVVICEEEYEYVDVLVNAVVVEVKAAVEVKAFVVEVTDVAVFSKMNKLIKVIVAPLRQRITKSMIQLALT